MYLRLLLTYISYRIRDFHGYFLYRFTALDHNYKSHRTEGQHLRFYIPPYLQKKPYLNDICYDLNSQLT